MLEICLIIMHAIFSFIRNRLKYLSGGIIIALFLLKYSKMNIRHFSIIYFIVGYCLGMLYILFVLKCFYNISVSNVVTNNFFKLNLNMLVDCTSEEIIWRGYMLSYLSGLIDNRFYLIIIVLILSMVFTLLHYKNIKAFIFWELFIFSILLGFNFLLLDSITFVIGIHFARNHILSLNLDNIKAAIS